MEAYDAKLLFSSDNINFLHSLGKPERYQNGLQDCEKFYRLFIDAKTILSQRVYSTFEMANVFLAMRNIASCYDLYVHQNYNFSRKSALYLPDKKGFISQTSFDILERARLLSTRGLGKNITHEEFDLVREKLPNIQQWLDTLLEEVKQYEQF